jgi:L-lactate dehydrogenase complex protein LldG
MNGDRTAILGRIREALREPAPRHHDKPEPMPDGAIATAPFREWLPPVEPLLRDRIALFGKLSEMLRTEFVECGSVKEAADHIAALATAGAWQRIALHSGALCDAVAAELPGGLARMKIDAGYDKRALEACDAGLTECECLVAQTGSVCVTSPSSGGRALSVLPPHHIVIARRGQVVPDLTAAYELLAAKYRGAYPSFLSFITGPSRTGDIERILVLGAHGPKKLTVLLVP